jgi:hypothetical protein
MRARYVVYIAVVLVIVIAAVGYNARETAPGDREPPSTAHRVIDRAPARPVPAPSTTFNGPRSARDATAPETSQCDAQCDVPCARAVGGVPYCPHPCATSDQCDVDALCLFGDDGLRRCLRSQCSQPGAQGECGDGFACRYMGEMAGGVYLCIESGYRRRGEYCSNLSNAPATQRCTPDLVCSAGLCVPATCTRDDDCGRGARCIDSVGGAQHRWCVASCSSDAECADDQVCREVHGYPPACIPNNRLGCVDMGCAPGLECHVHDRTVWSFFASCVTPCAGRPEACGPDEFCSSEGFFCYQVCTGDSDCPAGFICNYAFDSTGKTLQRACRPDISDDETAHALFGQYQSNVVP